jgi:hypothetical protein
MIIEKLRRGWVDFLSSQNYSHALTLKPNNVKFDAGEYFLRRNLDRFHRNLDRRLLGTRFSNEKNGIRRTRMVAIIEGLPFNGHIHAAIWVADELRERFEALFAADNPRNPWVALIPGGTTAVEAITEAEGWHEYTTKRFAHRNHSDNIIFLPRLN